MRWDARLRVAAEYRGDRASAPWRLDPNGRGTLPARARPQAALSRRRQVLDASPSRGYRLRVEGHQLEHLVRRRDENPQHEGVERADARGKVAGSLGARLGRAVVGIQPQELVREAARTHAVVRGGAARGLTTAPRRQAGEGHGHARAAPATHLRRARAGSSRQTSGHGRQGTAAVSQIRDDRVLRRRSFGVGSRDGAPLWASLAARWLAYWSA